MIPSDPIYSRCSQTGVRTVCHIQFYNNFWGLYLCFCDNQFSCVSLVQLYLISLQPTVATFCISCYVVLFENFLSKIFIEFLIVFRRDYSWMTISISGVPLAFGGVQMMNVFTEARRGSHLSSRFSCCITYVNAIRTVGSINANFGLEMRNTLIPKKVSYLDGKRPENIH